MRIMKARRVGGMRIRNTYWISAPKTSTLDIQCSLFIILISNIEHGISNNEVQDAVTNCDRIIIIGYNHKVVIRNWGSNTYIWE